MIGMEIVSSNRAGTRNVNKVTAMLLFEAAFFNLSFTIAYNVHLAWENVNESCCRFSLKNEIILDLLPLQCW